MAKIPTTPAEAEAYKFLNESVLVESSFNFLKQHYGFREGCLHVFMGTPSAGKSTMARTLILDLLNNSALDERILAWLSEENEVAFNTQLAYSKYNTSKVERLEHFSEQDTAGSPEEKFGNLCRLLEMGNYKYFIFDNITTSCFYDTVTTQKQYLIIQRLKKICSDKKIVFIAMAHTHKNIEPNSKKIIKMTDIRGTGQLANLAEYFYILESIEVEEYKLPVLHIEKHRAHLVDQKRFQLKFHSEHRIYYDDVALTWDQYKILRSKRNTLGDKR